MLWISFLLLAAVPAGGAEEALAPDCAIDAGPCSRTVGEMTVALEISPRPVRAMQELSFTVRLSRNGDPVAADEVEIDLAMPGMDMGRNRVQLRQEAQGLHRGRGVIVRCAGGRTLWKASVRVVGKGRSFSADFLINVP